MPHATAEGARIYKRKWREANRERERANAIRRYAADPNKTRAYNRAWRKAKREREGS